MKIIDNITWLFIPELQLASYFINYQDTLLNKMFLKILKHETVQWIEMFR